MYRKKCNFSTISFYNCNLISCFIYVRNVKQDTEKNLNLKKPEIYTQTKYKRTFKNFKNMLNIFKTFLYLNTKIGT